MVFWPGETVSLECSGAGPPLPNVYWTKGHVRLIRKPQKILLLKNISKQDGGRYSCHAVNYLGQDIKTTIISKENFSSFIPERIVGTFVIVVADIKFVQRPPVFVEASVSDTIVINCTAEIAPHIPTFTEWTFLHGQCNAESSRWTSLSNGSLVIRRATAWDSAKYICSAGNKRISASVQVRVTGISYNHLTCQVDITNVYLTDSSTNWMLPFDYCGGFRQSTYNASVYYAVSWSTTWNKSKFYQCPKGYYWACTEEGRNIFKNDKRTYKYVYSGQCGWSSNNFAGGTRYYFRFRDSASTNAHKYSENYDEYPIQTSSSTSYFAGIVCIKT